MEKKQRFGGISVSFFRWNAAVWTYYCGSFGKRLSLYLDRRQTKPLSKWPNPFDCLFPSVWKRRQTIREKQWDHKV